MSPESGTSRARNRRSSQRIRQRQDLEAAGHALHFGIEHEPNAAHGIQHPARGVSAVVFVMVEDGADREDDQRQHRSCNQKCEADWQGKFSHAGFRNKFGEGAK